MPDKIEVQVISHKIEKRFNEIIKEYTKQLGKAPSEDARKFLFILFNRGVDFGVELLLQNGEED
jgi:hypothetical protein